MNVKFSNNVLPLLYDKQCSPIAVLISSVFHYTSANELL